MNKLFVFAALACLVVTACEKRLSGDSPYSPGPSADRAPPVGTVTPASPTLPEVK